MARTPKEQSEWTQAEYRAEVTGAMAANAHSIYALAVTVRD